MPLEYPHSGLPWRIQEVEWNLQSANLQDFAVGQATERIHRVIARLVSSVGCGLDVVPGIFVAFITGMAVQSVEATSCPAVFLI